ncbi:MAG: hypothetical protein E7069_01350 [Bacteroidales bacterium]|jgi:hypothetical protein|nr:hypothetical protein [Bacteroidales bacterium]
MKRSLMLLSAFALGLSVSAQDATTTKRLVETQTIATYDYKAVFNEVTNNQKIATKTNLGNKFNVNLGSGKEDRKANPLNGYKEYTGTNLPAYGNVYIGDENKVNENGLLISNNGRGFVVDSLQAGDVLSITYTPNTEGEKMVYAMGTSYADSVSFTKLVDNVATPLVSGETTFESGEELTVASTAIKGRSTYFASIGLKGVISKVVITRGEKVITYDYAAEAASVFSAHKFATKNKLGSNSKFWANMGEGKEHRCDGNTTGYKEYSGTVLPKALGDIYIGDENTVDANGLKIQNKNRQFVIDSLEVGQSFVVEYTANDGSDMVYAMSKNFYEDVIFVNANGDTLVSGVSTIKSGEEYTLLFANEDTLKYETYKTRAPYFTSIGLPGYISKVTILKKIYEEVTPLTVTVAEGVENGEVKTSSKYEIIAAGDEITLAITPEAGYKLASLTVTDAEGKEIEVAEDKFTMPTSNVTIAAVFEVDLGEFYTTVINNTKVYSDGKKQVSVVLNDDFASVVNESNVATNVEDGKSVVKASTENITMTAVGGTTPADNPEAGGGAQFIDKDGNVSQWNEIKWTTNNQGDINYSYLNGTGNPYVDIAAEEIVTDGTPTGTYRAQYTYYEEDGSKGLPKTGLYYEFEAKAAGVLQVGIWANKGSRITYVVDKATEKAIEYKKEGYINGQNNADGTKKYLSNEQIDSIKTASLADYYTKLAAYTAYQDSVTNNLNPTTEVSEPSVPTQIDANIIGQGNQPFWGYIYFPVEAGKSYLVFQHSSQVGFSGYRFTKDATLADYTTKAITIPEITTAVYTVTATGTDSVKVTASATEAVEGDVVTFTATATASYKVESVKATVGGAEVAVTTNEDGTYSITAGAGDIVFTVTQALKDSENPTPVENIIANQGAEDNTIYDLSGRKVVNPTRGVYIKNGKKFIVK